MMDLMSFLSDEEWETVTEPLVEGFEEFQIVHRYSLGSGKYKYSALQIKDEIPYELHISGASEKSDPLKEIQMIKLRVDDNTITGMDDNGDCVVRKS